jgi:L-fuconolactonase
MLIDSHHHLWQYAPQQYPWINESMSVLRQDYLEPQLCEIAESSGVDAFVSVQARQTVEETETLLGIANEQSLIRGVVGWIPLADRNVEAVLDRFASETLLKGVRHVVQDEPDDRFLWRDDFNRGVALLGARSLVYDLLVFARQLPAAIEIVDRHPEQPFVLDHIAKPTIKASRFDVTWEKQFRELARREHVTCKFSGVVTEIRDATWNLQTIRPYWDVACEAFGPRRLMFGSDWPVCLVRCGHGDWLSLVRELAAELSADERAELFSGTAARVYHL